jgi:hypothetical protein
MQHGLYRASGRAGLLLLVVSAIIPTGKGEAAARGFLWWGVSLPVMAGCSRPLRARDRLLFEVILCSALAAADRQAVGRLPTKLYLKAT